MTCFHVCGWKKRRRELSIPAACNRSQLWPPPPQNSPQLSLISSHSLRHSHASKKTPQKTTKKKPHTPQSHACIQSNITPLMRLLFILLYILAQWHFFIDISVSEGGSVLCEAKKVSFCRNNLKQQWNINFFCQFKCIKRNQSPIWHLKSSMKDKRWHVCSAVTDGKWVYVKLIKKLFKLFIFLW